jgi:hypothetical protein
VLLKIANVSHYKKEDRTISNYTEVTVPMAALQNKTALLTGASRRIGRSTQMPQDCPVSAGEHV